MDSTITFIVAAFVLWGFTMLALIDIILKDFGGLKPKTLWVIIASIPGIGWIIYLLFGYKKGTRRRPGT